MQPHEYNSEQQRRRPSNMHRAMSVNVRLCGSVPRQDMLSPRNAASSKEGGARPELSLKARLTSPPSPFNGGGTCNTGSSTLRKTAVVDALQGFLHKNTMKSLSGSFEGNDDSRPLGRILEPPVWAVPAQGETRLEPVCEAYNSRHAVVDLTAKACFRIGRSPMSDVPLQHGTSSRRHAMLFHHSNGSCYVVDCGSAHGTYVNGVRIPSPSASENGGIVVPHKVKRGAMIRFGGPGAPCFILKSFGFNLDDLVKDERLAQEQLAADDSQDRAESPPPQPDMGELVRRNTRLNAMGRTADRFRESICSTIESALFVYRKRSFDSLDSRDTLPPVLEETDMSSVESSPGSNKRIRCMSPPLSLTAPSEGDVPSPTLPPIRLVSPELPILQQHHHHGAGPHHHGNKQHRVSFSEEPPQLFYPALVTPQDDLSGDEAE